MDKRKHNYIINAIRRTFYKWPPFWEATARAQMGKGFYHCENPECGVVVKKRFTEMDHTNPVVSIDPTKNSLEEQLDRLLCSANDLKRLCIECHNHKTHQVENKERVKVRRKNKKL